MNGAGSHSSSGDIRGPEGAARTNSGLGVSDETPVDADAPSASVDSVQPEVRGMGLENVFTSEPPVSSSSVPGVPLQPLGHVDPRLEPHTELLPHIAAPGQPQLSEHTPMLVAAEPPIEPPFQPLEYDSEDSDAEQLAGWCCGTHPLISKIQAWASDLKDHPHPRKRSLLKAIISIDTRREILAGVAAAFMIVPGSIAFAFVAGVKPITGLYASFILGLSAAAFGGRPGMVAGATGAVSIVQEQLVKDEGAEVLFATMILAGVLQLLVALFGWGKFVNMLPHSVMMGFVNGLAIVTAVAQLGSLKLCREHGIDGRLDESSSKPLYDDLCRVLIVRPGFPDAGQSVPQCLNATVSETLCIRGGERLPMDYVEGSRMGYSVLLVVLTMVIMHFSRKIVKVVPGSLISIGIVTGIQYIFDLGTPTVGDKSIVSGKFPSFHLPDVTLDGSLLSTIFPVALSICIVGLTESLMTLRLLEELMESPGNVHREAFGQGLGNTICGFFAAQGGCALIGESILSVKSGGRTRLTGISAAFFVLAVILAAYRAIELLPMASLVGVMFMVVFHAFDRTTFLLLKYKTHRIGRLKYFLPKVILGRFKLAGCPFRFPVLQLKVPVSDFIVVVVVTAITPITHNLAIAVGVGLIIASLVHAWKTGTDQAWFRMSAELKTSADGAVERKVYHIDGPLFFASVHSFQTYIAGNDKLDPNIVELDFSRGVIRDLSGIQALAEMSENYHKHGKQVLVSNMNGTTTSLLFHAGRKLKYLTLPTWDEQAFRRRTRREKRRYLSEMEKSKGMMGRPTLMGTPSNADPADTGADTGTGTGIV